MPADRLSLAIANGVVELPDTGDVGVYTEAAFDLPEVISGQKVHVISPWSSVVAHMQPHVSAAGAVDPGPFGATILRIGRSRAANRLAIGQAMAATRPGGPVLIDGQKTDGIDALWRDVRARVAVTDSYVKHHGRLFWLAADPEAFADWARIAEDWPKANGFHTAPGGFSADGPDEASVALADALPDQLPPGIADLGAGWGYLAGRILSRAGVERVALVEGHFGALAAARQNILDPRARFYWADATSWQPDMSVDAPIDAVVMNPPFHKGRAADPSLGQAFVAAAARILSPDGTVWLVANRQLPYEARIADLFAHVETRPAPAGFKIIVAHQPRRESRKKARHRDPERQGARP